jgi:hypothetical protein
MDLERAFDLLVHMRENAGEDYVFDQKKGIVLNYKQQGSVLHKSIQAFFQGVAVKEGDKVIQAFSGSSDLPQLTKDVFNVVNTVPNFDTLWQGAFQGVQLKKGQLSWEIADVAAGLVFELIPEGGKIKFYSVSGNVVTAKIEKYGAGIGVTWEMIEGRKLYQFVDLMSQVRARLADIWADIHYGLLGTAAATNPVAWQGVATDPVIDRDIATINEGYQTIGDAVKDKGYGDTANAEMLLYASPLLKARINQAMRATSPDIVSGRRDGAASSKAGQVVEYNVTPFFTWNAAVPANKAVMVLPRNKIQNSAYMQELSLSEKDIATLSEMKAYWSAFGAIVADADQTAELAFT